MVNKSFIHEFTVVVPGLVFGVMLGNSGFELIGYLVESDLFAFEFDVLSSFFCQLGSLPTGV